MARQEDNVAAVADEIAGACIYRRVRLLSRTVTALFDQAVKPVGITANQLTILVLVARLGEVRQMEVGRRLRMERSTVSRNVARLLSAGRLQSRPGTDARDRMLRLTRSGRFAIAKALKPWRAAQSQARQALGPETIKALQSSRFAPAEPPGGRHES